MAERYTPETIDVKVAYCSSFDPGFAHKVMAHMAAEMTTGHAGDFDRWLEKHDREVKAQAYEDAAGDVAREVGIVWPSQRHSDVTEAASYAAEVLRANARAVREGKPTPYAPRLTATTEEPM